MRLPDIDIAPFLSPSTTAERESVVNALKEACTKYGAFYLSNHGIDTDATMQKMKDFFALPEAIKKNIAVKPGGFSRGYIGMGEESGSEALEVKEAFSYGYPWPSDKTPENSMQGANVWPDISDWQQPMEEFYSKMVQVAEALSRAFSLCNGLPEDYLGKYCHDGDTISVMRLFHYLPYRHAEGKFPEQQDRIGSSAHTDWGFLTLILQQDDCPGLQLFHDNAWHDVNPLPGKLVVNCGDYFSLLTGGNYISPLHRVASPDKERISGVFFYYPSFDAEIPMMGQQDYSLFKNQQQDGNALDKEVIAAKPFGKYIQEKWEQVQRK